MIKEKSTFNLTSATIDSLDDAWIQLRRLFKGKQRVTKTLIVEKAIEAILDDLKTQHEQSMLYKKLTQ
ncbi:MAG: hypothetical protein WCE21_00765 [Candidatus Babeliales bacterium]